MLRPDFDPCPLCGGMVLPIESTHDFQEWQLRIECRKCRTEFILHGWDGLTLDPLRFWNNRPTATDLKEENKVLTRRFAEAEREIERLYEENERLKNELALALF